MQQRQPFPNAASADRETNGCDRSVERNKLASGGKACVSQSPAMQ
jgi:hypothetical protein